MSWSPGYRQVDQLKLFYPPPKTPRERFATDRGLDSPTPNHAAQPQLAHQPCHRAPSDRNALAVELTPHFARAVHAEVLVPDTTNLAPKRGVAPHPRRRPLRIRLSGLVFVIRRWGDRHHGANRLDPILLPMLVDERHHHLLRRSSSAWAKYADALRRISWTWRLGPGAALGSHAPEP